MWQGSTVESQGIILAMLLFCDTMNYSTSNAAQPICLQAHMHIIREMEISDILYMLHHTLIFISRFRPVYSHRKSVVLLSCFMRTLNFLNAHTIANKRSNKNHGYTIIVCIYIYGTIVCKRHFKVKRQINQYIYVNIYVYIYIYIFLRPNFSIAYTMAVHNDNFQCKCIHIIWTEWHDQKLTYIQDFPFITCHN